MSSEMLETLMTYEWGGRRSGRTTRAVESIREWASAHPDQRGVLVAHDHAFAQSLKREKFNDLPNVDVVSMHSSRSIRGLRIGALEVDHYAVQRMVRDVIDERDALARRVAELESER